MRLCRVRILTMRMGRQEIKGGACVCKNRFDVASSKIPAIAFSFHRKRSPSLPEGGYTNPTSATHDGKDRVAKAAVP